MEGVYLLSTFYGWRQWSPQAQQLARPISTLTWQARAAWLVLMGISIGIGTGLLHRYSPSTMPLIDASIIVLGLASQWWLCQRNLECWYGLLAMDTIITYIQFERGIPFHVGLYLFYCGLAVTGAWRWQQLLRAQALPTPQ